MSQVYFYNFEGRKSFIAEEAVEKLYENLNLQIDKGDIVGIKVHAGEYGNRTFLRPQNVKPIVDIVKNHGGTPVVFDTTTLYNKKRNNALDYHDVALEHGYTHEALGAHVLIADGIKGYNGANVEINGGILKEVEIASAVFDMDSLIVLSHFKGHNLTGFGGAIKNLGMGCVTKRGKAAQHRVLIPKILEERCVGCGTCVDICSYKAPYIEEEVAKIDEEKCVGCHDCVPDCPERAIRLPLDKRDEFQERMADAACAVKSLFDDDRICFFNFLTDVTAYCDCVGIYMQSLIPDVGILASRDPVAIDKASLDLVCKKGGREIFYAYNRTYGEVQLETAESLGMGSMGYELAEI
ncbi:MAG: 4Fe-4S ferredoxin [Candidatus Methanolliviera sp. GoM_asphalt]|nr:MAG: 4Fe-4S ferredoxin [Candidatus Methanolliviera sp. GoM_asphalt]